MCGKHAFEQFFCFLTVQQFSNIHRNTDKGNFWAISSKLVSFPKSTVNFIKRWYIWILYSLTVMYVTSFACNWYAMYLCVTDFPLLLFGNICWEYIMIFDICCEYILILDICWEYILTSWGWTGPSSAPTGTEIYFN